MKTLLLSSLLVALPSLAAQSPNFPAPKGTIPYNTNLCTTSRGVHAFGFVKIKAKLDSKGCTHPVKAWVYADKLDNWISVPARSVTCCDPSAAAGMEP